MKATMGPGGWGAGRFSGGQAPHLKWDGWPHSFQNLAETEKICTVNSMTGGGSCL
jgi:hypothetical protein